MDLRIFETDDEDSLSPFEEGEWKWDETNNELVFVSHRNPEDLYSLLPSTQNFIGPIIFKDDIDPLEQERFQKRYHRKTAPGEPDIVTLQDIKDVVFYTAPIPVVTKKLINVMHMPVVDRFLRTLILFCQYYLQVLEEMERRRTDGEDKIRTENSDDVEKELRDNLSTLRLLIAKEYCPMLIETTVHQLLNSESFLPSKAECRDKFKNKNREEKLVLWGETQRKQTKLTARSHLLEELLGKSKDDYRMFGLGIINYSRLTSRLQYLDHAISAPEEKLPGLGISLGIIGQPRTRFTVMLKEIKQPIMRTISPTHLAPSRVRSLSKSSKISMSQKSLFSKKSHLYPDIVLPAPQDESYEDYVVETFSKKLKPEHVYNKVQYQKWLDRLNRIKIRTKHVKK